MPIFVVALSGKGWINPLNGGQADQNPTNDTLQRDIQGLYFWDSDELKVEVQTDGYGHQIYWEVTSSDSVIASGGNVLVGYLNGSGAPLDPSCYLDNTYHEQVVDLSEYRQQCITIRVLSGYGYGTCCTWGNGFIRFKKGNEVVYNFTDFGRRARARLMPFSPLEATYETEHVVNNAPTGSITFVATNGVPEYSYSIDCGQTFNQDPIFDSLAAGVYCVHTRDLMGNIVEDSVEILNTISGTEILSGKSGLYIQPNPARDRVLVTLVGNNIEGSMQVNLRDAAGALVQSYHLVRQDDVWTISMDVSQLPDGIYFVQSPFAIEKLILNSNSAAYLRNRS